MTREEYIGRTQNLMYRLYWRLIPLVVITLAAIVGLSSLVDSDESSASDEFRRSWPGTLLYLSLIVLILVIGAVLLYMVVKSGDVACPHCGKPTIGQKHVVIASRHCPHCGKRMLDDNGTTDTASSARMQP